MMYIVICIKKRIFNNESNKLGLLCANNKSELIR